MGFPKVLVDRKIYCMARVPEWGGHEAGAEQLSRSGALLRRDWLTLKKGSKRRAVIGGAADASGAKKPIPDATATVVTSVSISFEAFHKTPVLS